MIARSNAEISVKLPKGILEAARIDGADVWKALWYLLRPMTMPGLASTARLLLIFSWNECSGV